MCTQSCASPSPARVTEGMQQAAQSKPNGSAPASGGQLAPGFGCQAGATTLHHLMAGGVKKMETKAGLVLIMTCNYFFFF